MAEAPVTKKLLPGEKRTADNTLDSEWKKQPPVVIDTDGEQVTCELTSYALLIVERMFELFRIHCVNCLKCNV